MTGGGAIVLNKAFVNSKNLNAIYSNYEQAAAISVVEFTDLCKIDNVYGIEYYRFNQINTFIHFLNDEKIYRGSQIIELICPENESIILRNSVEKSKIGEIKSEPLTRKYPILDNNITKDLLSLGFNF